MKFAIAVLALVAIVGMSELTLRLIGKLERRIPRWRVLAVSGLVGSVVLTLIFR